jgi:hypothetical protein
VKESPTNNVTTAAAMASQPDQDSIRDQLLPPFLRSLSQSASPAQTTPMTNGL